MSRKQWLRELGKVEDKLNSLDKRDDDSVLPPCNGIDRILFQARFINRAYKIDPVLMAPIIEATKKSLRANLARRPELSNHKAVVNALAR